MPRERDSVYLQQHSTLRHAAPWRIFITNKQQNAACALNHRIPRTSVPCSRLTMLLLRPEKLKKNELKAFMVLIEFLRHIIRSHRRGQRRLPSAGPHPTLGPTASPRSPASKLAPPASGARLHPKNDKRKGKSSPTTHLPGGNHGDVRLHRAEC